MTFPIILPKRENCNIHIILDEYQERKYLDIREFYMPDDSDEWLPTKRGLRLDHAQFSKLLNELNANRNFIDVFLEESVTS